MNMRLSEFHYNLPNKLIAQYPLHRREKAKLLVVDRKKKKFYHAIFSDINKFLPDNSTIVLNNSKVIPARLFGFKNRTGGKVEIFLLNKISNGSLYNVLLRPFKRIKNGDKIFFKGSDLVAIVIDRDKKIIRFSKKYISEDLSKIGHMPLPPYIKRMDKLEDRKYYQTVFAKEEGSVASPTAGLHFTNRLLEKLKNIGYKVENITLHVNYATFRPVESQDITMHKMHYEEYKINKKTFERLKIEKNRSNKIVAVGTTSCRVIESVARGGKLKGNTNIFMYPGYKFKMVDVLITNFHLPYSTLLMLVYAFGGSDFIKKAYKEAIKKKYRFYSYGDAMLIL